jgi:hypothetical protein
MNIFRKSRLISLVFSVAWLLMSLSYTFGTECLCCNHSEPKSECCEKTHATECCLDLKHPSNDCQCECFSCGKSLPNDDLLKRKEYINTFGNDQLSALEQIPSYIHISVNKQNIVYYQSSTSPLKSPSLFLINSSFLL